MSRVKDEPMLATWAAALFAAGVLLALSLAGCITPQQTSDVIGAVSNAVQDVINHNPPNGPTPPVDNPATNAPAPAPVNVVGKLWDNVHCAAFMCHGVSNENEIRENALNTAKARGLNCVRCDFNFGASDELLIHLTFYEHETKPGYYNQRDNWAFKARDWGVTRFAYDLGVLDSAKVARMAYVYKSAESRNHVQFVVSAQSPADLVKQLQAFAASNALEVVVE